MLTLSPEPLTREAFQPFGDLIATEDAEHFSINDGFTERYHHLATIDAMASGGRAVVSIFRSRPLPQPIRIDFLERHPLGSQAFMPLTPRPYLVLVALRPEAIALRLFMSNGRQGVNYHRGVWHYPLLALERESDFLVIDRVAEDQNCELARFDDSPAYIALRERF